MRLLVDANISYRLVAALRDRGHDATSILEETPDAADVEIIRSAVRAKRTIITYDKDFGELVFRVGERHYGVILLRTSDETYETQIKLISHFFATHQTKEIQANFWVLTETATRQAKTTR